MNKKIIGVTVGSSLPKPNFKQTDPTKGDYIRNKPDFDGLKDRVDTVSGLVGDTAVAEQISEAINNLEIPEGFSGSWNDLEDKPFGETIEKHYLLEETENLLEMRREIETLNKKILTLNIMAQQLLVIIQNQLVLL